MIPSSTGFSILMGRRPERNALINFVFFRVLSEFSSAEQGGPQGKSSLCLQRIDRTSDHCQGVASLCVQRIDQTSDDCQRIFMCTTDTPCPCSFIASTPGQFFTQTLCKSFKIHCVVPIPQKASLQDFSSLLLLGLLLCTQHFSDNDHSVDHVVETTCSHDVGETAKYLQPVCFCRFVGETAKYLQSPCFCWFVGETAKYLQPACFCWFVGETADYLQEFVAPCHS